MLIIGGVLFVAKYFSSAMLKKSNLKFFSASYISTLQLATKCLPRQDDFVVQYQAQNTIVPEKITWLSIDLLLDQNKNIITNGGFIHFYNNYDSDLHLAVKFRSPKYHEVALREVCISKELQHDPENDFLLPILHASATKSKTYIMLISKAIGLDLYEYAKNRLKKTKKFQPSYEETILLLQCITKALLRLHALNLVYSDIKHENIVTDANGKFYLIDFDSMAKGNENGKVFNTFGTIGLISLERLCGKGASISDDIWCLSIVLYEFITNEQCNYNEKCDFTAQRHLRHLHLISQKTLHWTKFQRRKIKNLFTKMNEHDSQKRIQISNLQEAVSFQKPKIQKYENKQGR